MTGIFKAMENSSYRCSICQRIGNLVFQHLDTYRPSDDDASLDSLDSLDMDLEYEQVILGSFKMVRERADSCPTCRVLVQEVLRRQFHVGGVPDDAECDIQLLHGSLHFHATFPPLQITMLPTIQATNGVKKGVHTFARPVPTIVDTQQLKMWIRQCELKHGSQCVADMNVASPSEEWPLLLIDVRNACIVKAAERFRYVALSYVWGQVSVTRSLLGNINRLMQRCALADSEIEIPATIKDAMNFVELLGERYLWVDAFCIVQDDYENKQKQLNAMGNIYRHAVFTLIASAGDHANYGLPGVPGGSKHRSIDAEYIEFLPGKPVLLIPRHMSTTRGSVWDERAWTFQEGLFSPRSIIISNTVKWNCRCIAVSELVDTPAENSSDFAINDPNDWDFWLDYQPTPEISQWPDAWQYILVVVAFNQRKLTYATDIVDAFAGVISNMSRYFHNGFHFGLPELIFDIALLWQPQYPLKRRKADELLHKRIPSWSWIGWEGEIDPTLFISACDWQGNDNERKIELFPTASEYHYCAVGQDEAHCSIGQSYHRYREKFASNVDYKNLTRFTHSLPDGWYAQAGGSDAQYNHPAIDKEIGRSFAYPLPISNTDRRQIPTDRDALLHFDTTAMTLVIGDVLRTNLSQTGRQGACDTDLRTPDGRWAGVLRHNTTAENLLSEHSHLHLLCTLVAISTGRVRQDSLGPRGIVEWDHAERAVDSDSGYYEFYNVLWVEDVQGVYERKGLGRVVREIWDAERAETHVVLG